MILAAVLASPAVAQPVPGAVRVGFATRAAAPCLELANWLAFLERELH
jgi:hypothetical protein